MTRTARDIVDTALKRIRVLGIGENVSDEDYASAREVLDVVFAEISAIEGLSLDWDLETIPDEISRNLAWYLAALLANDFHKTPPETVALAWVRLRACLLPNDVVNRHDADNDGVMSESEIETRSKAVFY